MHYVTKKKKCADGMAHTLFYFWLNKLLIILTTLYMLFVAIWKMTS